MKDINVKGLTGIVACLIMLGLFLPAYGAQKTPDKYINQGREFLKANKAKEAITSFTEALKLSPRSVQALNGRGVAYCKEGDIDKAIADFSQAIEINPNFGKAYNNRAAALWSIGEYVKAEADIKKAQSLGMKIDKAALAASFGSPENPAARGPSPAAELNVPKNGEKQAPQSLKSYTPEEKQAYQKRVASDLAEIQKKIENLLDKMQKAPVQKRLTRIGLISLLRKRHSAQKQLLNLESASEGDWSNSKANMDFALDILIRELADFETSPDNAALK